GQGDRIKTRVHRHRDENGAAPLVGNRETGAENKKRRERWQMSVDGGEEQRADHDPHNPAEIAFHHSIQKEPEKKFLGHGRDGYRQNDDQDSLFERVRGVEQIDDRLLFISAAKKFLRQDVGEEDQRIRRHHQNNACRRRAPEPDLGKAAQQNQIDSAQPKKDRDEEEEADCEDAAGDKFARSHSRCVFGRQSSQAQKPKKEQGRENRLGPVKVAHERRGWIYRTHADLPDERDVNVNARHQKERLHDSSDCRKKTLGRHAPALASGSVEALQKISAAGFQLRNELLGQRQLDLRIARATKGA